ncbi:hypothetical protein DM02DRAFT_628224 [Periconia macrospinosa]|uniref:Uncharacterized protein n=1 Tax=Periconia macrospinosa TaxID=97972 RepID=A0A2V1DR63_9PLEO|nr:hypothetical protein DM02DRAFT_628224 [Periconia macrospinosa]
MAVFNDLAVELQQAIWNLVLPSSRGVHWVEIEGIPRYPDEVRDSSIRQSRLQLQTCYRIPETHKDVNDTPVDWLPTDNDQETLFFRQLFTTVPAAFGEIDTLSHEGSDELQRDKAAEIAYTRRCRQLSTYSQITALLSTCRMSRWIAEKYIQDYFWCSRPIHRSMGTLYRPRPLEVWEAEYSGEKSPAVSRDPQNWQVLRPRIHILDLVIFRLHDIQGRATSLLRHGPWQYNQKNPGSSITFGCFHRVGLEWNPFWGTPDGYDELRAGNVAALISASKNSCTPDLYWIVDGVPRPDWKHDYPPVVESLMTARMDERDYYSREFIKNHWRLSDEEVEEMTADRHLGQEFEANGRRYYVVFVMRKGYIDLDEVGQLDKAGVGYLGPFPGSAAMWPQALRAPVRYAFDVFKDSSLRNMRTHISIFLSWEPIH